MHSILTTMSMTEMKDDGYMFRCARKKLFKKHGGGEMEKQKYINIARLLLVAAVLFCGSGALRAAQEQPAVQTQAKIQGDNQGGSESRSMEAVLARRGKRITHEQRKAAAARFAANPAAAARLDEYRTELTRASENRIKELEARNVATTQDAKTAGGAK